MVNVRNYTVDEFLEQLKEKKVICFGAGKGLSDLCKKYTMLASCIDYVVDNNRGGSSISVGDRVVDVKSINEIGKEVEQRLFIITTLQYADEMVRQLDEVAACDDIPVYIPTLFDVKVHSGEIHKSNVQVIPKKIHYCWFGKSEMPQMFQKNIETWKEKCPDYEICRWDESNYDITKNRYMLQAYEAKRWGFVPDYARLDIVNTHGGVYLDTDVELLRPLDELLQFEMFCGFESVGYVALGLGFGAKANHKILLEMMEEYDQMDFINQDGSFNMTASPVYQTRVLEKHGLRKDGNTQEREGYIALSQEYLAPINPYGYGFPTANSFSIHQYAATWFDAEQRAVKERFVRSCQYIMQRMT